jgi:hypothetical protein
MQRGRPRDPYRAAVAALQAGIADRLKQNAVDESLIADLLAREGGTRAVQGPVHDVPPKKHRRRRHKSRPVVVRKAKRRAGRSVVESKTDPVRRRVAKVASVAEKPGKDINSTSISEPVAAKAKAVRGAAQFAAQLAELEKMRAGIAAGGNSKAAHALRVRGDAVLREMAGKAKLPPWLTKAERMRWRRCADRAPRMKKPRKPTPAPRPVIKKAGPWIQGADGTLSREIASVEG